MQTRLMIPIPETAGSRAEGWLDVERAAIVEITSEEKGYPVESAFVSGELWGWLRRTGPPNDSADFRPAAKAETDIACL